MFGAADLNFSCVVRGFSSMFSGRRFGGGALAVYLDGRPVVDVWTGWSDRAGRVPWTADRAPMVFSATKGIAAAVIHRLADRGLIDYEAPVAEYWPEFGANGKAKAHRPRGDEAPRQSVRPARSDPGRLARPPRHGATARRGRPRDGCWANRRTTRSRSAG